MADEYGTLKEIVKSSREAQLASPIKALRLTHEHFKGYVHDEEGAGQDRLPLPIRRRSDIPLTDIECGLGSSVTGAPRGVEGHVEYQEPFAKEPSQRLIDEIGLENTDPDQVIWRTNKDKLIDDLLRVLPDPYTDIVTTQSDKDIIAAPQTRNKRNSIILEEVNQTKTQALHKYLSQTNTPCVAVVDGNGLSPNEVIGLEVTCFEKGHLLILKDTENAHREAFQAVPNMILVGQQGNNAYAVLSKEVFEVYKDNRMVFMLPPHAVKNSEQQTNPEYEAELTRKLLERYKLKTQEDQVLWGEGSYDVLEQLIALLPSDQIHGLGPHFPYVRQHALRNHKEYVAYQPTKSLDMTHHLKEYIEYVSAANGPTQILYVDTPNNPSGFSYDVEELRELAGVAREKGHALIIDCAYGDLVPNIAEYYKLAEEYDNVVVVGSFSKNQGMAGDRVGYGVMGRQVANIINPKRLPSSITEIPHGKTMAALERDALNEHIESSSATVTQSKKKLVVGLETIKKSLAGITDQGIDLEIASTSPEVSILFVRLNGLENTIMELSKQYAGISVGRILQERWGITCEAGDEFTQTHEHVNGTGFRLRIPKQIEAVDILTARIYNMVMELRQNPHKIFEL